VKGLSVEKAGALQKEITSLLEKRAIERAPRTRGFYARVFLVPKKGGSYRPVFNLKPLNQHIHKRKFKMATVRTVAAAIRPGDFAVSIDLQDAYLHVPILPSHKKFLRFTFKGQTFQFRVLPFGLSSAPRSFTKLTRVIVIHCRALGLRLILYLDDGLLLARPLRVACQQRDLLVGLFLELGWLVNWEKSDLAPSQDFTYVGLDWSSRTMSVSLPVDKLQDIRHKAGDLLAAQHPPPCRRVQQFLGKVNFAAIAIPRARLHMRALQADLARVYRGKADLFKKCPLSQQARDDLLWWSDPPANGMPLSPPLPTTTLTTDACRSGWGAQWAGASLSGTWSEEETKLHINALELKAAINAVRTWAPDLRGQVVALQADNKTAVAYLLKEGGTRSRILCHLTRVMFRILDRWDITLRPAYLKGIANVEADCLSRGLEVRDWCLRPEVARQIFSRTGHPSWDLFASRESSQAPFYYSIESDSRSQGTDCLLQDWSSLRGTIYAFPPPQLIPQTLQKLVTEQVQIILIAPCWEDSGEYFLPIYEQIIWPKYVSF